MMEGTVSNASGSARHLYQDAQTETVKLTRRNAVLWLVFSLPRVF